MQVIGSVFSGAGKDGDFDWMITEDHYEDALFVFNDNEGQYKAHRDQPTDLAGAGWSVRPATRGQAWKRLETIYFLGLTLYCTRNRKGNFKVACLSTNLPALREGAVPVMFTVLDARSMTCG